MQIIQLNAYPNDLAITKIESIVVDGVFFLDFSRKLEHIRWCGMHNKWLGITTSLLVPVVHQGEKQGGYVITVNRNDQYFADLLSLWKERYPSNRNSLVTEADGFKIITDFATQFPSDC